MKGSFSINEKRKCSKTYVILKYSPYTADARLVSVAVVLVVVVVMERLTLRRFRLLQIPYSLSKVIHIIR